jgi:hypothetical protein
MEGIEIKLHPNNMNRELVFCLRRPWKAFIVGNLRQMTVDQGY